MISQNRKFMERTKYWRISIILTITLLAFSEIKAQGPNAPEAASFEPMDVTDVVNLVTGDFTYTIPTIEVPGPNGGYPLTMAYHAGIAVDQESSWVGLGWSMNAGAINRNVNGFPDDWDNVKSYEYYWNKGETQVQHTIDVSIPIGITGLTVGLGASWGSLRGFSGTVGLGVAGIVNVDMSNTGISASTGVGNYAQASIGLGSQGYFVGAGVNTGSSPMGGSLSVGYSESSGLVGGAGVYVGKDRGDGKRNYGASLGITTNGAITYGLGSSIKTVVNGDRTLVSSAGGGGALYNTTLRQDDMTIKQSGFTIPAIFVNYRKEKVQWYVDTVKKPGISGSLYSDNNVLNVAQDVIDYCESQYGTCDEYYNENSQACDCIDANGAGYGYSGTQPNPDYAFTDISEINTSSGDEEFSILDSNPALLNHDGYHVSGQGMSGMMSPRIFKNISLVNVNHDFEKADLSYYKADGGTNPETMNFYFDNELSGGVRVNKVSFSNDSNPTDFDSYIDQPAMAVLGNKRSGNFVEYFTYDNLPPDALLPADFAQPSFVKGSSIAGFRITSPDGVTYNYMLPVYNMMEKMRSFNYQDNERDVYSEKTNNPYATHWLLTSITGPDFVDVNSDGTLDEGDYGYWVDFDYGKWSNGMVWRTPGKEDEYTKIKGTRRYTWGVKELYYLDKITTRTHTALFIKELREDAKGVAQRFIHKDITGPDPLMPSQKQLRLKKIVLLQNERLGTVDKTNATDIVGQPYQHFGFTDPSISKTYSFSMNHQDNVLDVNDGYLATIDQEVLREISFGYDYSLAPNSPNTDASGKLTLRSLYFKGKGGASLLPPYRFGYSNNPDWDYNNENYWGYNHHDATVWSMDEIITPQGSKLLVEYEPDEYGADPGTGVANYMFRDIEVDAQPTTLIISADVGNYDLKDGDQIYLEYDSNFSECDRRFSEYFRNVNAQYSGIVTLVEKNQSNTDLRTTFTFELANPNNYAYTVLDTFTSATECNEFLQGAPSFTNISGTDYKSKSHAGIRVNSIAVSDNIDTWKTTYEYDNGSVPYEPFYNFKGVSNQTLLRAPNVLYGKVTVRNLDADGLLVGGIRKEYDFITDNDLVNGTIAGLNPNATSVLGAFNSFNTYDTRDITYDYKDYQGAIGNLKSQSIYQESTLISKLTNNYSFLDEASGFVNTESTQLYKSVNPKPGEDDYQKVNHLISTSYTKYPVVLSSSESVQGGIRTVTYLDKHDLDSGVLLESRFYGSDGKEFKTVSVPAYTKYPQMGSKEDNIANKHMLTQNAASYTLLNNSNVWTPIDVNITTWSNEWDYYNDEQSLLTAETDPSKMVWRKHLSYIWNGVRDGSGLFSGYNFNTHDGFNWATNGTQTNSAWKRVSEVSLYDRYSMPLEIVDINGNRATTKMGYDDSKVVATGVGGYDELYYSGAEDIDLGGTYFGGGVLKGSGTLSTDTHTGEYALNIGSGQSGYLVNVKYAESATKMYKISLWAKKATYQNTRINVGGSEIEHNPAEEVFAGDWVQLNYTVELNSNTQVFVSSNGGSTLVDDFRMHPVSSSITSYVYNEWGELSHTIGANNMATRYNYDGMGRLISTDTEAIDINGPGTGGFKKAREIEYTYKY